MSSSLVVSSKSHRRSRSPSPSISPKEQLDGALAAFEDELLKNKSDGRGLVARFKNLRGTGKLPDLTAVVRFTEELSNDCATRHGGWREYAMRITPFLDRLRQFFPIGDVLVGGAQNMIASGVWAAVRLAIETSLSFLSFFDKVSEMLFRASKSFLLHHDFSFIFPQSEQLQDLVYEYLTVTIVTCTRVVHFAQKPGWSQITSALVSSADSILDPLENQLKEIGLRIQLCANALAIRASQESHALTQRLVSSIQTSISHESRLKALEARKYRILTALCPNQGDFDAIYRQYRRKAHSGCLFNDSQYQQWSSIGSNRLLWLRGKMGSGKSIIMASAVADLTLNEDRSASGRATSICYFFCTGSIPTTLKAGSILGSLAYQVLSSASVSKSLTDYVQSKGTLRMEVDPGACVNLLLEILPKDWHGRIVIDGLDDCSSSDVTAVFEQLHRLSRRRTISVLSSCRTLWKDFDSATALFEDSSSSTILIEDMNRYGEVDAYISGKMQIWKSAYSLSSESEDLIRQQLRIGWAGMFLWLALQCEVISEDLSEGIPVGDIMSNLPGDLPKAYHDALLRIKDKAFASRMFKLVVAADPALSIEELRAAANITPGEAVWRPIFTTLHDLAFLRLYGGHLLEMDENRKVHFIHHSVMMHLLDKPIDSRAQEVHIDPWLTEQHFGFVLITYLNLPHLNNSVATRQQNALADYAQAPDTIIQSVASGSRTQRVLQHLRPRPNSQATPPVDIAGLLMKANQNTVKPLVDSKNWLIDYAKANWLEATKRLDPLHDTIRSLWEALMQGRTCVVIASSVDKDPVSWAISNRHMCLMQYALSRQADLAKVTQALSEMRWFLRPRGTCWLPIAVRLLEDESVRADHLEILWKAFDQENWDNQTYETYVDPHSTYARMQSMAPVIMQILIMYTWSEHVASFLITAMSSWYDTTLPVYKSYTALELAYKFLKSNAFATKLKHWEPQLAYHVDKVVSIREDSTPLIRALRASNMDCVKLLLDYGADIEQTDGDGQTILMHAMQLDNSVVVSRLLSLGAKVAVRDVTGRTALHHGSRNGTSDALHLVLSGSSNVNSILDWQDKAGRTALHEACAALSVSSVRLLVDAGARQDLRNRARQTPFYSMLGIDEWSGTSPPIISGGPSAEIEKILESVPQKAPSNGKN